MRIKLFISALAIVALGASIGVITENRIGIVNRVSPAAGEDLTIEFGSIFEFAATQQFAASPEYLLTDLATDAVPLANGARQRLSEISLDANDVQRAISDMLLEIVGMPMSRKDVFMLNTVSIPIMTGANYGKFAALRDGVVEPEDVNRMVTAYATTALDGLLRFLLDLPCPEEEEESEESDAKQQLDKWADELDPVRGL